MKKILLLGGSAQQVIAIETAKKMGYYTVLCDYLTDNPGQYIADQFYLISTTDKEAVLEIAQLEKVDGVLAYASDPAAPTAAYVAEELGLPGNPYDSVKILCNKDLFRDFLKKNGFFTPKAGGYSLIEKAVEDCREGEYHFPLISKPVDSSGSKGVVRIDALNELRDKLNYSMSYSRVGKIVIEEYIEQYGYQVAGDGISVNGDLVFRCFANDHFNSKCKNPFVPIAASFPYDMSEMVQEKIQVEIQRLLDLLGMKTCTYNFDIRIDKNYNVYLMEVAPRDGGNYIPQVIKYATGVDLVESSIKAAMGEPLNLPHNTITKGFWSYYAVHSLEDGILQSINVLPRIKRDNIVEDHIIKGPGDRVSAFTGANTTLGCYVMKFKTMGEMLEMMDHSEMWINVKVKKGR